MHSDSEWRVARLVSSPGCVFSRTLWNNKNTPTPPDLCCIEGERMCLPRRSWISSSVFLCEETWFAVFGAFLTSAFIQHAHALLKELPKSGRLRYIQKCEWGAQWTPMPPNNNFEPPEYLTVEIDNDDVTVKQMIQKYFSLFKDHLDYAKFKDWRMWWQRDPIDGDQKAAQLNVGKIYTLYPPPEVSPSRWRPFKLRRWTGAHRAMTM